MSNNTIKKGEFTRYTLDEGVFLRHYFGKGDNVPINTYEIFIVPGYVLSPHTHDNTTEYFHVISGEGELWFDGKWVPIKKGEGAYAPPNIEHGARCIGPDPLIMFAVFNPAIL